MLQIDERLSFWQQIMKIALSRDKYRDYHDPFLLSIAQGIFNYPQRDSHALHYN